MSKKFTLDHLTDTQFEEYCFDLLKSMGFVNVHWRKGTGHDSSPSDQGRDIEAELIRSDIDSSVLTERWFIECKHYKEGVPPTKFSGAITWAEAERPDVLLLIASNFFSNPAKEYLVKYKANNRPTFRTKQWELPDLKDNSKGKPLLLSKYSLSEELEFLNIMHPAHLEYIKHTQINTLDYFFACFDKLEASKRDEIASWLYMPIIQPRHRESTSEHDTMGDLLVDPVDYETFKKKCYSIKESGIISEIWFAPFMVSYLLQATFAHGDTTTIDQMTKKMRDTLDFMDELAETDPEKKENIEEARPSFQKHLKEIPNRIKEGHDVYVYFCENMVTKLLDEQLPF
jgi:hypothetical protein